MVMLSPEFDYMEILEIEHGRSRYCEGFSDDSMLNIFSVWYLRDGFRHIEVTLYQSRIKNPAVFAFENNDFIALGIEQKLYGARFTDKERTKVASYASSLEAKCRDCKRRILRAGSIDGRTVVPPIQGYFCGVDCLDHYRALIELNNRP